MLEKGPSLQTSTQRFYSQSMLKTFTRQEILRGGVIKINPALITITDGRVRTVAPEQLQREVETQVRRLLAYKIKTFHVDVNFEDYSGYGASRPDLNTAIFTPLFLQALKRLVQEQGGYLNMHLLTDFPGQHLTEYESAEADAVCFQLDTLHDDHQLAALIEAIRRLGACASPVIETVGSDHLKPSDPASVFSRLSPFFPRIGMLTLQTAGTTSRSNTSTGTFAFESARSYLTVLRQGFFGTLQLQGGITTQTIGAAVRLGTEFLVCGTEIFRNREGRAPEAVIDELLQQAAQALAGSEEH